MQGKKTETVDLVEPITVDGVEHKSITLRRLKGKDIKALDTFGRADSADATFFLLGRLSGLPPEAFDEMDAADIEKCSQVIEGFTGRRRRR